MSLYIASLNSGSNGNCYYIGNENEAILVDAGISCRETEKRLKRLGLSMQKVKAVFVSHEHADHIKGLATISKKYQLPVYITAPALFHSRCVLDKSLVMPFVAHETITIGSLATIAFPKFHDASDPYSFIIKCNGINVGVFTDIGFPCKQVITYFRECHAAFLEANYDDNMLESGNYPYHLKKRIRGGQGHLSNAQALELFKKYRPPFMSHLFLSHLSKNNNCPELVQRMFDSHSDGVKIVVASRFAETSLYYICGPGTGSLRRRSNKSVITPTPQLSFSF